MGKPKKGRQARQDENGDEDIETDLTKLSLTESVEDANEVESKPVSKKKEKKAAKAKALSDEEDSDAEAVPAGGKKGKAGFQLLALGSDDEMKSESEEEEVAPAPSKKDKKKQKKQISVEEDDEEDGPAEPAAKQQPKKKNKKEKKQKEVEEDLDAILAEIDGPAKKSKKKKKGKETSPGADNMEPEQEVKEPEPSAASKAMEGRDLSAMTQDEIAALLDDDDDDDMDDRKKKKKKDKKPAQKEQAAMEEDEDGAEGDDAATSTVKTKAQKQKEKRERQKQQKQLEKTKPQKKPEKQPEAANEGKMETSEVTGSPAAETSDVTGSPAAETSDVAGAPAAEAAAPPGDEDKADDGKEGDKDDDDDGGDKKKKKRKDKKKNKGEEEEEKEKKKKPSKMAMAILEQQKKLREEEDRIKQEEEERQRKIDEAYQEKEDKAKREKEKRELVKQKKKEKIERLKAEGKFMTEKEKEAKRRAAQMLEALKAQGVEVPQVPAEATKKKKIVYDTRKKKVQKQTSQEEVSSPNAEADAEPRFPAEVDEEVEEEGAKEKVNEPASVEPPAPEEKEDIKDSWDVESEEEEEEEEEDEEEEEAEEVKSETKRKSPAGDEKTKDEDEEDEESGSEEESDEDSDEGSEESDSEEDSEDDGLTAAERAREKALARIQKRKDEAEKNRSLDVLRAPVVCVLGHVDTGKTKILDKLRRTHVQDDEAGGITQQIGATNVPMDAIKENTKMCKEFTKKELKVPGLLIIDTPGHESFSNLRSRGSSLCDIAILVVDIMHGLEPQTIESINLLKQRKTPFIVALNKVDRLYMWQSNPHNDVVNTLKKQKINTKQEFDERTNAVIVQFSEQGLNACLFHENKNPREYVSLVPTSAHSGDGMGNLLALTCELTQSLLAKRLAYSENLQATVMEVKAIQGLGTTIDVILVNGCVKEGETIIVAGQEGPIITQIRGLLMPQPMRELRVKSAYEHHKEVHAAQGVKIIAKDLDKALAGLPMHVAYHPDEVAVWKDDIAEALSEVLDSIKLTERGVFVQASTLGSLEALLEFLRTSKIPYAGINIGPVHKKDVMKASVMLEHDNQYATILAFDVKVEREAQEMADSLGVRIFTAEIIYHLFDKFTAFRTELKRRKQEEFKNVAVFPCKVRILPQYIFNSRDPIVMGVVVDAGFLKVGTPICVPSKEFVSLGRISSLELNNKNIDKAVKGQEVCIKIENPGETPKMFGRHFDATDLLISKISRDSIDAVKNYFREEMGKNDWQLMVELKKLFEII